MAKKQIGKRIFSYDEALNTFPLVRDLTSAAVRQIEALTTSLASRDELDVAPRRRSRRPRRGSSAPGPAR